MGYLDETGIADGFRGVGDSLRLTGSVKADLFIINASCSIPFSSSLHVFDCLFISVQIINYREFTLESFERV